VLEETYGDAIVTVDDGDGEQAAILPAHHH
jgi:hypothetical protein